MKIVVNHKKGISDLLSHPDSLDTLVECITSPNLTSRTSSADFLLAIVAISYPEGHGLVMQSFENYQKRHNQSFLFQGLVNSIQELVQGQGIMGSRVGAKRDALSFYVLMGGNEKRNDVVLQREIKEYLVSSLI